MPLAQSRANSFSPSTWAKTRRAIPAPEQHFHDSMFSVYAQDVVKMAKKLTLSLGLRYELPNYAVEDNGVMGLFNPALPNPGAGGLPGALEFLGKSAFGIPLFDGLDPV